MLTVRTFLHCPFGASLVQCCDKEPNHVAQAVTTFMDFLGLEKICLRTDGEPASGAPAQAIKIARLDETQLETTPRYSSSSLGAVERSNRSVEGQIRCMRIALEKSADKSFGIEDNIFVWLCRVQTDGLTPPSTQRKTFQWRVGRIRRAGVREGAPCQA